MNTTIKKYVNSKLPKRGPHGSGYRLTFEAKKDNVTWIIHVQNDTPSRSREAVAVKKGTKGATPATRQRFDWIAVDPGYIVNTDKANDILSKL